MDCLTQHIWLHIAYLVDELKMSSSKLLTKKTLNKEKKWTINQLIF